MRVFSRRSMIYFAAIAGAAALAALIISSCSRGIPVTGQYVPELDYLDAKVMSFLDKYDIPGAAAAVAYQGRLVYARGFGYADEEAKEAVQPGSLFRLASVSKTVTGMALSKLVEDGLVSLEDKVFGPDGILNDAQYQTIGDARVLDMKVWHLLTHTSGFHGETEGDPQFEQVKIARALGVAPPASHSDVISYVLANDDLEFAPGTQYLYSNVGYNVLGRIVEKRTGMTYEEYVRSLLAQIGVSDMYIAGSLQDERRSGEVKYYDMPWCVDRAYDGSGRQVPCSYGMIYFPTIDSHGGWIASPIDLLKFLTAIDGFGHRAQMLTPETISAMKEVPEGIPGAHAYNGWGVDESGGWKHSGALGTGTFSYLSRGADEIEFAIVFNSLSIDKDGTLDDIVAMLKELIEIESGLSRVTAWPTRDLFD
jgi:CubicO group peptidase (beta-lactamase class C family)